MASRLTFPGSPRRMLQRQYSGLNAETNNDPNAIWVTDGIWVILAVVGQSLLIPYLLGRPGYLVSALLTAGLVAVLANKILHLQLSKARLFGLMLLTITFMRAEAIGSAEEFADLGRLSWYLTAAFALYLLAVWREIIAQVKQQPLLLLFALFTLMMIIWSIPAGRFSAVLQRQTFFLLVVIMTAEFLLYNRRAALALLYAVVLGGLSATVMVGLEYYFPDLLGLSRSISGLRTAALYLNPNAAAFAISFSLVVLALLTKIGFPRRWAILIFLIVTVGVFSTFSRKGALWLVFALVGFSFALFAQRQQTGARGLVGIGIATLALFTIGYGLTNLPWLERLDLRVAQQTRLLQIGGMYSGDIEAYATVFEVSGRSRLFGESWAAIRQNPWLGYGPTAPDISRDAAQFQPHNTFLLIWVEYGLFNILLFILILLVALGQILRTDFYMRLYGLLFMAHLLVMLLGAHTLLHNRFSAVPLAFVLVFAQIPLLRSERSEAKANVPTPIARSLK